MRKTLLAIVLGLTAIGAAACGGANDGTDTFAPTDDGMTESLAPIESPADGLESPSDMLESPASS